MQSLENSPNTPLSYRIPEPKTIEQAEPRVMSGHYVAPPHPDIPMVDTTQPANWPAPSRDEVVFHPPKAVAKNSSDRSSSEEIKAA